MSRIAFAAFVAAVSTAACRGGASAISEFHVVIPALSMPTLHVAMPSLELRTPRVAFCASPSLEVFMVCGGVFDAQEEAPPLGLVPLFGSADELRIALSADTIEIVELRPNWSALPVRVSPVDAVAMRASLTCDSTYHWDRWRDEISPDFRPDFRVTLKKGDKTISIDLCLASRMARVTKPRHSIAPVSLEFGYSTIARVIEHYFPGATDETG